MTEDRPPELGRIPITASIIGVQKAATSTMHTMLTRHRLVAPTFQNDPARAHAELALRGQGAALLRRREARLVRPRLLALLRQRDPRAAGARDRRDAVVHPVARALERMRAFNPEMLLVASFRDPIERAFSQWSMGRKQKNVYPEFSEAIELYDDESMLDRVPPGSGRWSVHRRSMVIRGLYGAQLERGLAQFPRESWLMLNFAEWVRDYQGALDQLTDFLGIHRFRQVPAAPAQPDARAPRGHPAERGRHRQARRALRRRPEPVREAVRLRRLGLADASHRGRGDEPGRAGRQVRPQVRRPRRLTCRLTAS